LGVTSHAFENVGECEGMNLHTPKGAPILGARVLVDSKNFREQFLGVKTNGSKNSYITRKLLEHRCLKWARMTHLDTSNISYGQKKG